MYNEERVGDSSSNKITISITRIVNKCYTLITFNHIAETSVLLLKYIAEILVSLAKDGAFAR